MIINRHLESVHDIIQGCINKQPVWQRMFYDRYRGFACKVVFRYIYRYEKAMDIVTDGFIKVFTHFDEFNITEKEPEKVLMAWIKKIMIHCSIDELRRGKMIPEIGGIPDHVWEISDKGDDADRMILYKDLVSVVKELPPHYRSVFNLYVIDGYSHSEIAEMMHTSESTSRSTLSRAKAMLQKQLINMEEGKLCRI